ncbi:MAG: hypothetical protein ABJ004_01435 [Cyclobacteriaceae bacterium]
MKEIYSFLIISLVVFGSARAQETFQLIVSEEEPLDEEPYIITTHTGLKREILIQ